MKLVNKACIIVTLGAIIGIRHHSFRSKSHTFWQLLAPPVSQLSLSPVSQHPSGNISGRATKSSKDAEEPLRTITYLSFWGPYQ
ncbi:hypothetical protein Lser_V15G35251 [Lactuca serriola]